MNVGGRTVIPEKYETNEMSPVFSSAYCIERVSKAQHKRDQGSPAFPLSGGRGVGGFGGGGSLFTALPGSCQGVRCLHKHLPPSWAGLVPTNPPHGHLKFHPRHPHRVLSAFFIAASSLEPLVPFCPSHVEHRGLTMFSFAP